MQWIENDRRLNASTLTEQAFHDSQTAAGAPPQFLGVSVSRVMAVGSSFAAVAKRATEIGTL